MFDKRTIERFWSKVKKMDGGCWEWQGYLNVKKGGHGGFRVGYQKDGDRRIITAHRYSYLLHSGDELLSSDYICHHCDNAKCVNPAHIYRGSAQTNHKDMENRGRAFVPTGRKGERNGRAKINVQMVRQIRKLDADGIRRKDIADMYGVTRTNVYYICTRKSWAHVQ